LLGVERSRGGGGEYEHNRGDKALKAKQCGPPEKQRSLPLLAYEFSMGSMR
jgi:hypothetical protein